MNQPAFSMNRRAALALAVLSLLALAPQGQSFAADYPERPLTGIVPFAPGGASDTVSRLFANNVGIELGKPIIVENKPGAGGNLGIALAMQAKADGYTILFCATAMTQNPGLYKTLGWNPDEVQAVAQMGGSDQLLVANVAHFPSGTLQDFVAYMKKNPGKVNFASQDSGLTANLFRTASGTQFEIINYSGGNDAAISVMSGETDIESLGYASALAGLTSGKTRPLAVAGPARLPQLPDTPTTAEAGMPLFLSHSYFGVFVRKGTPRPVIDRLNAAVNKVGQMPEVIAKMASLGFTPVQQTPEQFDNFFRTDIARWKKVVAESGIKTLD